jgi:predicted HicB family RNase H-like nuclease
MNRSEALLHKTRRNPNVSAFGATPAEALSELKTAWQLVKESYQVHGEPLPKAPSREGYEGPLNIPVDAKTYHALVDEAAKAGISLYALAAQKLAKPTPANDNRSQRTIKRNAKSLSNR